MVITVVCGHCSWVGLFYLPDFKGSPEGGGVQYYLVCVTYSVLERFSFDQVSILLCWNVHFFLYMCESFDCNFIKLVLYVF